MDASSHPENYAALILRTNQTLGARTRFSDWNGANLDGRVSILEAILADSDSRMLTKSAAKPSEAHAIQRSILETTKRKRLHEVVSKFVIADASPGLRETYEGLKAKYCGHIPQSNQDQYLGALLNVVIRPDTIEMNWTITKDAFKTSLQSASSKFGQGNKRFPQLVRTDPSAPLTPVQEALRDYPFVKKIRDIDHHEGIPQAIRDYQETTMIVFRDFRDHSVELPEYIGFATEVEAQFSLGYTIAQQENPLNSKLFYDKTIREQAPPFSGFESPPREFKNGVIHMHLNNQSKQHKWKLVH